MKKKKKKKNVQTTLNFSLEIKYFHYLGKSIKYSLIWKILLILYAQEHFHFDHLESTPANQSHRIKKKTMTLV